MEIGRAFGDLLKRGHSYVFSGMFQTYTVLNYLLHLNFTAESSSPWNLPQAYDVIYSQTEPYAWKACFPRKQNYSMKASFFICLAIS